MKLLKEITESMIGEVKQDRDKASFYVRKASRAILFNEDGKLALLHVTKDHYHKLPGGGIEIGEDSMAALERELLEEVGVRGNVTDEIGMTIEYREQHNLLQISYCYTARTKEEPMLPAFTKEEQEKGFLLKWVEVEEAIHLMESDNPVGYVGKFIRVRDLTFIKQIKA